MVLSCGDTIASCSIRRMGAILYKHKLIIYEHTINKIISKIIEYIFLIIYIYIYLLFLFEGHTTNTCEGVEKELRKRVANELRRSCEGVAKDALRRGGTHPRRLAAANVARLRKSVTPPPNTFRNSSCNM